MFEREPMCSEKGYFHLVFHAWNDDGKSSYEELDGSAWGNKFEYTKKKDYENNRRLTPDEYLNENFNWGGMSECLIEDVMKEVDIQEGEDRYFEVIGEYHVKEERDYYGEYSTEDEVYEVEWQEIAKEEWEERNEL